MLLKTLTLENFCCFDKRQFQLAERFNLLIGDNGSGKTSILNGLAVGVSAYLRSLPEKIGFRPIHPSDVRFCSFLQGDSYTREKQFPVVVTCQGVVIGESGTWSRMLNGGTRELQESWLQASANNMGTRVRAGEAEILPIISYYGTGRLLQKRQQSVDTLAPGSRFLGYVDCLDPVSDEKRLLAWFKTMEIQSIQEKKTIGVLEAVRQAIVTCVEHAEHVWFNVAQDELLLRFADREVPFNYLSAGYRNMLAMVAGIASRCATLNPALKEEAIRETPGVVLIDEIDLHLHPKWQRRVVNDLLKAFPKIQFVATTHSPFIIQSLVPKDGIQLLNLDNAEANDFADKSVEDIAEEVQGVAIPQRSQRFIDMMAAAERYYAKLREGPTKSDEQLEQLKQELDRLILPFSDDPAYQAFLRMQRTASGIDERNGHASR